MNEYDPDDLPEDLDWVARYLREERTTLDPLELDRIKLQAKARSSRFRPPKRMLLRSRLLTLALAALLIGGTTAGGIAAEGGGDGNAAQSQYRPGLGCGDTNHIHTGPPGN